MTRHDVDALIARLNQVTDPESAVEPDRRAALLRDILTTPAPLRRRRPTVRRLAVAGATLAAATAIASAILLAGGERPGAPQRFAVVSALADELRTPGRILHTLERTTTIGADGRAEGAAHEEESWTLLDDMRYERFRIGSGSAYEEGAMTPTTSSDYQRRTNTFTVVRYGPAHAEGGPITVDELPVDRLAQAAADGRVPVEAHVEIDARRALRIRNGDGVWYIAQDAPVLLRHERTLPDGRIQRSDFAVFEILPATAENRRLLAIRPPADAERETVRARAPSNLLRPPSR
jgi:hypothetical protein